MVFVAILFAHIFPPFISGSRTQVTYSSNITKRFPLPTFFLIGIPKSSTTSLNELLITHPAICQMRVKEPHYFDSPYPKRDPKLPVQVQVHNHYGQLGYYREMMGYMCQGKSFLDATTHYFTTDFVPSRMKETFSYDEFEKIKIILILRNPAAREFSWYQHNFRNCYDYMKRFLYKQRRDVIFPPNPIHLCEDFHCDILKCRESANSISLPTIHGRLATYAEYVREGHINLNTSKYVLHLSNWLQHFRRDQIFIINFENLVANTTFVINQLSSFLGVGSDWWESEVNLPRRNEAGVINTHDCTSMEFLTRYFQPYNEKLYKLLRSTDAMKHPAEPTFDRFVEVKSCI